MKKEGFPEALAQLLMNDETSPTNKGDNVSYFLCSSLFSSFISLIFSPKKREGKLVYFRFLSVQKLTAPMMLAIATAAMIATSVVINGVSGVGSGEGDGDGEGSGEGDGSGSIVPPLEAAGPTVTYVAAPELP